jgi:type 1 fimbria pilin
MKLPIGLVLVTAMLSCAESPDRVPPFPGYGSVQAGRDCGPAGGGTIAVVLRPAPAAFDTAGPQLKVTIRRDLGEMAGKTFASTDQPESGTAFECIAGTCETLAAWQIRFDEVTSDSSLVGILQAGGPGGTTRRGSFRAAWHTRTVYCI